ncbi:hypothetical protein AMAG_18485 [Allomyces macrogynus ATCC 38327]|uniref:Uncharacterized protein n=1 Tax=Allomyces macrogynus (strain ATCC 38327) TaxID=578462 RepID=A0A0L0SCD1_ALLM3|nr:hypothetical protein AMAG_18485 [Allomyces macrogynus ATCC 38327]|eukprot:KNE60208.1 hypothetical protein AMAG_18485 [Allomyces macrogynus ATCC 38327]
MVGDVAWLSVYDRAQLAHGMELYEDEWVWPLDVANPRILLHAVKLATARKIPLPPTLLMRMCAPPPIVVRDRFVKQAHMPRNLTTRKLICFSGSSRLIIYFAAVRFAWETARFQYSTFVVDVFRTIFDGLQLTRVASGKTRIDEAMHARLRAIVRRSINTHSEMVTVNPAGYVVLVQHDELPAWT